MIQPLRLRASVPGTGVITYGRPRLFGGVTLLRGEAFTGHYRPHLHTTYVVGVVESGCLGLGVGGRVHLLTAGCILVLNPCQVHEEFSVGPDGWTFRYFFPSDAVVESVLGRRPWFSEPVVRDERLAGRLGRLHQGLISDSPRADQRMESGFADALGTLAARHAASPSAPGGLRQQVLRIRDHLHEAPGDSLRLETLAKLGGLSRCHLVRVFHREIGLPPHAYYEQLRIARCKELLHDQRRLSEVAFLMRYSDQSHFTRTFGGTAGVSPGKYATMVNAPGQRIPLPAPRAQFHSSRPDSLR